MVARVPGSLDFYDGYLVKRPERPGAVFRGGWMGL